MTDIEWDDFCVHWVAYYQEQPPLAWRDTLPTNQWATWCDTVHQKSPELWTRLWALLQTHVPELTLHHEPSLKALLFRVPPLGGILFTHFRKIFSLQHGVVTLRSKWKRIATNLWLSAGCSWHKIYHASYDMLLYQTIQGACHNRFNPTFLKRSLRARAPCMTEGEWITYSEYATIHFDGGFAPQLQKGVAVVVATNQFRARLVYMERLQQKIKHPFLTRQHLTSMTVEAVACFRACELAKRLMFPSNIYGDCLSVIENFRYKSALFHAEHVRPLLSVQSQLQWVPRMYNSEADFWTK